jgi:DNA polymerase-3 subunit delta'
LIGKQLTIVPPWFSEALARYASLDERLPHALLIHGQAGVGKRVFGRFLARALLCEAAQTSLRAGGGCGMCAACVWFDQGNHPDFRRLTSEAIAVVEGQEFADDEAGEPESDAGGARSKRAPSREIKVEQVRALQRFLSVATHRGRARVVLLYPLEAVNDIAANALLKMLEEPPSRTVFILVADHLGRVPATVVSRCQRIPVATPPAAEAAAWLAANGVAEPAAALALAGGAPMAALAALGDEDSARIHRELVAFLSRPDTDAALATAEAFGRSPPQPLIRWMQLWLADCLSARLANRVRYHPAQLQTIVRLANDAEPGALNGLIQRTEAIRRSVDHPLNTRLMLEGLFTAYADVMAAQRQSA